MQHKVCSSTMDAKHSVAIFPSIPAFLPNRLSSIIDLPVVAGDGLSQYICGPPSGRVFEDYILPRQATRKRLSAGGWLWYTDWEANGASYTSSCRFTDTSLR